MRRGYEISWSGIGHVKSREKFLPVRWWIGYLRIHKSKHVLTLTYLNLALTHSSTFQPHDSSWLPLTYTIHILNLQSHVPCFLDICIIRGRHWLLEGLHQQPQTWHTVTHLLVMNHNSHFEIQVKHVKLRCSMGFFTTTITTSSSCSQPSSRGTSLEMCQSGYHFVVKKMENEQRLLNSWSMSAQNAVTIRQPHLPSNRYWSEKSSACCRSSRLDDHDMVQSRVN